MADEPAANDIAAVRRLRRCIMSYLYAMFKQFPYAVVELRQIEEECGSSTTEVNWNMVYLEKCGLVALMKSDDLPPYVACAATLTAAGIELVEDPAECRRRFPE